ncbi:hypothetical protein E4K67_24785 [Desulfosporosinus fructosivorans]|uniref:DUF2680 domain-containing protein n=1 Tax=Desulfosporosinus fructosivorans TaxID=2018669 RepID=A0A4Z0R1N8_9FIRM|nr:hypothetical protein [Desulfosporosinus fructosivorans]TGE35536.1 hypothetical protein E4K67_24785 [Desulfosporosinus fructosivorans]
MEFTNTKEETSKKKRTTKFAMLIGTALIASTLFASTALASSNPVNDSSDKQPAKKQLMLSIKNGSGDPIDISGSSPEMIKAQVDSLVQAGKLSKEEADKILSFDGQSKNFSDTIPAGDQRKLVIKNESGDQIKIVGTSPEMLKSKVEALVEAGKLSREEADKILSSDNPAINLSDSKPAGNQMMLVFKNESGEPIKLSGSSPEMIKSQVQALLEEGKISQQTADKVLNGLPNLPSKE